LAALDFDDEDFAPSRCQRHRSHLGPNAAAAPAVSGSGSSSLIVNRSSGAPRCIEMVGRCQAPILRPSRCTRTGHHSLYQHHCARVAGAALDETCSHHLTIDRLDQVREARSTDSHASVRGKEPHVICIGTVGGRLPCTEHVAQPCVLRHGDELRCGTTPIRPRPADRKSSRSTSPPVRS
jgi:hypothetical protein